MKIRVISSIPVDEKEATLHSTLDTHEVQSVERRVQSAPEEPTPGGSTFTDELQQKLRKLKLQRAQLSSSIYQEVYGRGTASSIEISTVLDRFNHTYDEQQMVQRRYSIRMLTAKGTSELLNCRKKVIDRKREHVAADYRHNLKQHGNIMLLNEHGQPRTIKVATIYEFKDHQAKLWQRVRH